MRPGEVLVRPIITEKSTQLNEKGCYIFEIAPGTAKPEVKTAVEKAFNVHVTSVNIVKLPGKSRRYGPRYKKTSPTKKAVVTLKSGEKIQIFEGL
jgi:large subunit ribosomal protein L23